MKSEEEDPQETEEEEVKEEFQNKFPIKEEQNKSEKAHTVSIRETEPIYQEDKLDEIDFQEKEKA